MRNCKAHQTDSGALSRSLETSLCTLNPSRCPCTYQAVVRNSDGDPNCRMTDEYFEADTEGKSEQQTSGTDKSQDRRTCRIIWSGLCPGSGRIAKHFHAESGLYTSCAHCRNKNPGNVNLFEKAPKKTFFFENHICNRISPGYILEVRRGTL